MTTPTEIKPHDTIRALCAQLSDALHYGGVGDDAMLEQQAQILNALFHATLAERLDITTRRDEYADARNMGWLALALKIQKQCVDTIRTQQATRYMDSLTTKNVNSGYYRMTNWPSNHQGKSVLELAKVVLSC